MRNLLAVFACVLMAGTVMAGDGVQFVNTGPLVSFSPFQQSFVQQSFVTTSPFVQQQFVASPFVQQQFVASPFVVSPFVQQQFVSSNVGICGPRQQISFARQVVPRRQEFRQRTIIRNR